MKIIKFSLFENNDDYIRSQKIIDIKDRIRNVIVTNLEEDYDSEQFDFNMMLDEVLDDYLEDISTKLFDKINDINFENWNIDSYEFQKHLCEKHPDVILNWVEEYVSPKIRKEYDHLWSGKNVGLL